MRILIATGIYPPDAGGPATHSRSMAEALTGRGHEVMVVAYGEKAAAPSGWPVKRVSKAGGIMLRYLRYFFSVLTPVRQADVVYVQGPVSEGLPAALASIILRKKYVMKVVGDVAWEAAQRKGERDLPDAFLEKKHTGKIRLYETIERWTAKHAWEVIVPSRYLQTVVSRWGVPSERITVIKNAAHPLPEPDPNYFIDETPLAGKRIFLTVVRAVPWKGIDDLISWWKDLPRDYVFVVAGDGPELEKWKALAKKEGAQNQVIFPGRLQRSELAAWYHRADVFVLPSGYEGYAHVIPEACSVGLPCLVSDQGGNPETKLEFPGLVEVVPYKDKKAWIRALTLPREKGAPKTAWSFKDMVDGAESVLRKAQEGGELSQVLMIGFEKELLVEESDALHRISDLAGEEGSIHAYVLGRFSSDARILSNGVSAYGWRGHSLRRIIRTIASATRQARRLKGRTVISAQDPFVAGLCGYVVSRLTNAPLEVQEHADAFSPFWIKESYKNRCLSFLGRFLLRRAERVRVVSGRVKQRLVSIGVDAAKIDIIPVSQKLDELFSLPLRSNEGGGSVPNIVIPCRFVEQKGLDVLLNALSFLKKRGVGFTASLIGKGPLEEEVRERIRGLDLESLVSIQPWKPTRELWIGADLFVLSSRYEGWARTIVEAMAAGVPIVATEVGCVGSFFRPGIDGYAVPVNDPDALADTMQDAIKNPGQRNLFAASARERAAAFPTVRELHEKQRMGWKGLLRGLRNKNTGPRWELWVLLFILYIAATRLTSVFLFHDSLMHREWGFFTLVDHFLKGYGYSFAPDFGCLSAYRSPGYLFFLTGLYSFISPENTFVHALVQNVIAGFAIYLVYAVGKKLVGKRGALIGGVLMASYPYTFYHFTQYYHSFLSTFFLLLLVWFLLKLKEEKTWKYAVLSGIGIACLAYVQGTILPVSPFIVLWLFWMWWPDWKRALKASVIMAVISASLIAPWTYRNWKTFHAFVPLTTDLGHALFKANNEYIYEITKRGYPMEIVDDPVASSTDPNYIQFQIQPWLKAELEQDGAYRPSIYWTEWHPKYPVGKLESCEDRGIVNEYEWSNYWKDLAFSWMREHYWSEGWKVQSQKVMTFWQPALFPSVKTGAPWSFADSPLKVFLARWSVAVAAGIVIFGGWIGLLFALVRKKKASVLVLAILLVYTLMHSLFAGYTKYRIPLDHLLAPFAGYAIIALYEYCLRRK